jgi:hypothetical protein
MGRRFRDRERHIGRNPAEREPKHRILVVCEGKVTEPEYFKALQHEFRNPLVHVEIHKQAGVPLTVVGRAIDLDKQANDAAKQNRDDDLKYDDVWCVFDVDEHPRLDEALALAQESGVKVALSNPCIELWGLLHFQDQNERIHRHEAQRALKAFMPKYDKTLDFSKMKPGYEKAVARARVLQKLAEDTDEPNRNPSTGVYLLTELIRIGGA